MLQVLVLALFSVAASTAAELDSASRKVLSATRSSDVRGNDRNKILKLMNSVRGRHQAGPLRWSNSVARSAQSFSNRCSFGHDLGDLNANNLGENLYGYSGPGQNWGAAVNAWTSEAKSYNYGNPGFSGSTGHFTAVVWRSTRYVGCGYTSCPGLSIYSCRFSPPGNYYGQFSQQVKPPRG